MEVRHPRTGRAVFLDPHQFDFVVLFQVFPLRPELRGVPVEARGRHGFDEARVQIRVSFPGENIDNDNVS